MDSVTNRRARLMLGAVQPTPFCNIDCKYCYLTARSSTHRMTPEVLDRAIHFLLGCPELLTERPAIAWHFGEPLTVPLGFYEHAFELETRHAPSGMPVENRFTTNATLINQAWCELFRRWQVTLKVSLDGPQWLHDANRVTRAGKGTFAQVMRGIDLLRRHEVPFHLLAVLTSQSLGHADELWRFYRSLEPRSIGFCIEEIVNRHETNSLAADHSLAGIEAFFARLLELRDREAPQFYIRETDQIQQRMGPGTRLWRREEAMPFCIVNIAWDGGISMFSPELLDATSRRYGDFIFGNVLRDTLRDLVTNEKLRAISEQIDAGIHRCATSCPYFRVCGGGWPAAKIFEHDDLTATETLACRTRIKAVANAVFAHRYRHPHDDAGAGLVTTPAPAS